MRSMAAMTLIAVTSACAGAPPPIITPPPGPSITTAPVGPPAEEAFRPPAVQRESGLQLVIGSRAERLTQLFGAARIDLTEGDARKLQFANEECVLDIFLYPLERDQEPVATHVAARRPQDGSVQDKAGCIAELRR